MWHSAGESVLPLRRLGSLWGEARLFVGQWFLFRVDTKRVREWIDMATENDVVLIYFEEKPAGFARIEEILPDAKPNWYHVRLLLLQLPLQSVTWILRDAYINGETFTMNGNQMRLEMVVAPPVEDQDEAAPHNGGKKEDARANGGKVISLSDLKKR